MSYRCLRACRDVTWRVRHVTWQRGARARWLSCIMHGFRDPGRGGDVEYYARPAIRPDDGTLRRRRPDRPHDRRGTALGTSRSCRFTSRFFFACNRTAERGCCTRTGSRGRASSEINIFAPENAPPLSSPPRHHFVQRWVLYSLRTRFRVHRFTKRVLDIHDSLETDPDHLVWPSQRPRIIITIVRIIIRCWRHYTEFVNGLRPHLYHSKMPVLYL